MAEIYRTTLEADCHRVTVIDAGDMEGPLLDGQRAEIVFLDIRAPHRARMQLLHALRAEPENERPPLVILSDYSWEQLEAMGLGRHRHEYLVAEAGARATAQRRRPSTAKSGAMRPPG